MLPLNVVEGSVRATISVTGKEFGYDSTFPDPISLSLGLGKPKPRTPCTPSEVSEPPLPRSSRVCGCISWFHISKTLSKTEGVLFTGFPCLDGNVYSLYGGHRGTDKLAGQICPHTAVLGLSCLAHCWEWVTGRKR